MRLSTDRERDDARAISVLHAAFDAGVTVLDSADAYCHDDGDVGHNERLIARALATWSGDRSRVLVGTKGGLRRPQGNWVADGRARHLESACEASRTALGVERIPLYQLHAPDPRTPLSTSVRALASLKRDGLIDAVGLCNVNVGQIEEARRIVEIDAVQVELSPWNDGNLLNGVASHCAEHRIRLIAYRPLGGAQRGRRAIGDPVLSDLASRHQATPFEIALAWLGDLSDIIVPIPGPTRVETARSLARFREIRLTDEDRARLDERWPSGRRLRRDASSSISTVSQSASGEIVVIMGLPAAGKSTAARGFVAQGYHRLNRDEGGGSLSDLLPALDRAIESGSSRVVLDNTYVSRKSRGALMQAAAKHRLPVRCLWLSTSVEDAQVNAVSRMIAKFGRLLGPEEIRRASRHDVSVFGPGVQFRYQRELEPPDPAEGFAGIETIEFHRTPDPFRTNRAVILWCDGVLRRSRSGQRSPVSADDVEILTRRAEVLRRYESEGWRLFTLSWQPEIAEEVMTRQQVDAVFAQTQALLGLPIPVMYCPHGAGPPVCWCRKPLPGLGVVLIEEHRLDPERSIYVGAGPQDPGFARRLGLQYRDAASFFEDRLA